MNRLFVLISVISLLFKNAAFAFMSNCHPPVTVMAAMANTRLPSTRLNDSSGWGDFEAMDDPLLDEGVNVDTRDYAVENDPDEVKARVGASLEAPEITDPPTDAVWVPAGSQLPLDEETVLGVLQAAREELGTLFGYSAENRGERSPFCVHNVARGLVTVICCCCCGRMHYSYFECMIHSHLHSPVSILKNLTQELG